MQRNKRLYKTIFSVIVFLSVVFAGMFLSVSISQKQVKADTQYYADISQYVVCDWQNYTDQTNPGQTITLTSNNDGTLILNGTTTTVVQFTLPLTISTISGQFKYFLAFARNNSLNDFTSNVQLYIGYNNGNNISSVYTSLGSYTTGTTTINYNNYALVIRIKANVSIINEIITPFLMAIPYDEITDDNVQQTIDIYTINKMLGPQNTQPPTPADLTKCVYVEPNDLPPTARTINTKINYQFNNTLDNLIEYTFQAEDVPSVDNTGVVASYIDLLTFSDSDNNIYKMRFNNDTNDANYLNIDLYTNNDSINFYNDNLGELSAQSITNFRIWCTNIVNAQATITGASAYDNNIITQLYVYRLGSSGYNEGYQDGEEAGYQAGAQDGFVEGEHRGYQDGYTDGYGEGYEIGQASEIDTNWLMGLFDAVGAVLRMELLPNLTIGVIVGIPFVISVIWFIIRQLRGGGGE